MNIQAVEDLSNDPMLELMARLVAEGAMDMYITLSVRGQRMDGHLVRRETWLDTLRARARNKNGAQALLDGIAQGWRDAELRQPADAPVTYQYLHLIDVEVPDGHLTGEDGYAWRIRMSDVSGWSMQSRDRS